MASPAELTDLRVDMWGNRFNSAGERMRNTEKIIDMLQKMAFPSFEEEEWSKGRMYNAFTFVHDSDRNSYVSITDVPTGVELWDVNYWVKWDTRESSIQSFQNQLERFDDIKANKTDVAKDISSVRSDVGRLVNATPEIVDSVDKMTDDTKNYVLRSSGEIYYWKDGKITASGILYQSTSVIPGVKTIEVDDTGKVFLLLDD
jgi:hypothetical protein